jgi:peroxiredoxin
MNKAYKYLFCLLLMGMGVTQVSAQQKEKVAEQKVVADERGYIVKVGDVAPDFEMTLTDGKKVKLSQFRGKVVMLQFTASWCGVCRKEMPFIESDIWQKNKDNNEFVLMAIDRDEPLKTVLGFKEQTKITYPLGLDPKANIFARYADREAGITRNVLIGRDGKIVKLTRLYNEEEFAGLVKEIESQLKGK